MSMQGSYDKCIWTRLSKKRKLICRISSAFYGTQVQEVLLGHVRG